MKLFAILSLALLTVPALAASKQDEMAGAILFRDKGCSFCHGDQLQGTDRAPALANVRKKLHADKITTQITHGSVQMPAFGDTLSQAQIAQLVAYLRAKHRPTPPPPTAGETPAAPPSTPQ